MSSFRVGDTANLGRSRARRSLVRLGGFGAAGLGLSALGLAGFGIPCPWRSLTGTLCPLCGSTHLGMRLLQLDVPGAFAANPFVFAVLVVLAVLAVGWTIQAVGGPGVRLPRRWRLSADQWWLVLGAAGVAFAVWRNVA